MFDLLGDVAERASIESTECYNVLCYERVLRACLELKAQRAPLADGAITFAIQGYAGPERLRVAVSGGKPEVAPAAEGEALPLTHRQAMNLFFGPWSLERLRLPPSPRLVPAVAVLSPRWITIRRQILSIKILRARVRQRRGVCATMDQRLQERGMRTCSGCKNS